MEEYHVLMLNSLIAATLCMAIISILLVHGETYGGSGGAVPLVYAVWLFSFAWLSVLLYIVNFNSSSFGEYFLCCNKIFLIAGYFLFLFGVCSISKLIFVIARGKEAGAAIKPNSKLPKQE